MPRPVADVPAWLRQNPTLEEMRAAFPAEWQAVEREIAEIVAKGDLDALNR